MTTFAIAIILQTVLALGLLNVWLLRARSSTTFRGGSARSLREEFAVYGLPDWSFYVVGALKIVSAVLLLVGIFVRNPAIVQLPAAIVAVLMVGALIMHAKVKDTLIKSLPAFLLLVISVAIFLLQR